MIHTVGCSNLSYRAKHGVLPEELVLGGTFEVDAEVDVRSGERPDFTQLDSTVNYAALKLICDRVMAVPVPLLEQVAQRIVDHTFAAYGSKLARVRVEVRKLHPPLRGGRIGAAFVRLERFA